MPDFPTVTKAVRPFRRARVFRFYEAFRDYRHGKAEPLEKLEAELFAAVNA